MLKIYLRAAQAVEAAKSRIKAIGRDESGATMLEYTLLAGLISVVAIAAITAVGTNVSTIWNSISGSMSSAAA